MEEKIAVIGAGLVGSLQSLYLAKRGFHVSVFERRPDIRAAELVAGRSINLALSDRGWKALEQVGLGPRVKAMSIPMYGRVIHAVDGSLNYQPYGKDDQAIYSVSRGGINQLMLQITDENPNVELYFDEKCRDIDLNTNTIKFENTQSGERTEKQFDRIFGTDGAFSAVRARLQKHDRFNYSQEYLTHGYKELEIPAHPDGTHRLEKNALHIWPRGEFMLIALPNLDGSFTVTLFFPFEGKTSFESIKTGADVEAFFNTYFPDAVPHMPELIDDYFGNPTSSLVMIKCSPWNFEDKICLLGDASHAIVPFYGQGMNSGFEDCRIFDDVFEREGGNWLNAFKKFSQERKPDADAILELAVRNYIEMRDKTADPMFLLQKKIEAKFYAKYPNQWMPLYSQVTFSHIPYSHALAAGDRQDKIMKEVMDREDIHEVWDSEEIEQAILNRLN
jgi:kynurenine 3-monooxygenase